MKANLLQTNNFIIEHDNWVHKLLNRQFIIDYTKFPGQNKKAFIEKIINKFDVPSKAHQWIKHEQTIQFLISLNLQNNILQMDDLKTNSQCNNKSQKRISLQPTQRFSVWSSQYDFTESIPNILSEEHCSWTGCDLDDEVVIWSIIKTVVNAQALADSCSYFIDCDECFDQYGHSILVFECIEDHQYLLIEEINSYEDDENGMVLKVLVRDQDFWASDMNLIDVLETSISFDQFHKLHTNERFLHGLQNLKSNPFIFGLFPICIKDTLQLLIITKYKGLVKKGYHHPYTYFENIFTNFIEIESRPRHLMEYEEDVGLYQNLITIQPAVEVNQCYNTVSFGKSSVTCYLNSCDDLYGLTCGHYNRQVVRELNMIQQQTDHHVGAVVKRKCCPGRKMQKMQGDAITLYYNDEGEINNDTNGTELKLGLDYALFNIEDTNYPRSNQILNTNITITNVVKNMNNFLKKGPLQTVYCSGRSSGKVKAKLVTVGYINILFHENEEEVALGKKYLHTKTQGYEWNNVLLLRTSDNALALRPGDSGGPVYNSFGKLYGSISARLTSGLIVATPVIGAMYDIQEFLNIVDNELI